MCVVTCILQAECISTGASLQELNPQMCILCEFAHVSGVVEDAHICLVLVFVHMYL